MMGEIVGLKEVKARTSYHKEFQSPVLNPDSQSVNLRRSTRKTSMPAKLSDFEVNTKVKYNIDKQVNYFKLSVENFNFSTSLNKTSEPKSYTEAANDIRWIEAMNQEMKALNGNGTWIITELLAGRKSIGSKWVYKVKYKSSGEVERFKARLVAKGYNQKEEIDYGETFSLVDVYMSLPEGYFNKDDNKVCKLVKSLYGLKQAPRKWNEKFTSVLIENDFIQSKNEFSLFTKNKNGNFIALLVYVDDIVITGNNSDEINRVKDFLSSKFLIKDIDKCDLPWTSCGILRAMEALIAPWNGCGMVDVEVSE
ncbi:putative RNA-directed DNA polymerase [Tanacetum coccineum]